MDMSFDYIIIEMKNDQRSPNCVACLSQCFELKYHSRVLFNRELKGIEMASNYKQVAWILVRLTRVYKGRMYQNNSIFMQIRH